MAPGRRQTVLAHSGECTVDEYYASVADFAPEPGAARAWCAAGAGRGRPVRRPHHQAPRRLRPLAHRPTRRWAVADSGIDRDLVQEFVDACRAEGLRVGFYLSLSDWHHPDYPAFRDEDRPYPFIAYRRPEPEAWARYLDDLFGQVRELLTNYGEIGVLWFDGGWERTGDRVAGRRAGGADPRAAARHPRSTSGCRRSATTRRPSSSSRPPRPRAGGRRA